MHGSMIYVIDPCISCLERNVSICLLQPVTYRHQTCGQYIVGPLEHEGYYSTLPTRYHPTTWWSKHTRKPFLAVLVMYERRLKPILSFRKIGGRLIVQGYGLWHRLWQFKLYWFDLNIKYHIKSYRITVYRYILYTVCVLVVERGDPLLINQPVGEDIYGLCYGQKQPAGPETVPIKRTFFF